METIDTNVLARVFVDDPTSPKQCEMARQYVAKKKAFYVPQVVQAELIWVLKRFHKIDKNDIVVILEMLANNAAYTLENSEEFKEALVLYKQSIADFPDCLVLVNSKQQDIKTVITFDKRFAKLPGVKMLQ